MSHLKAIQAKKYDILGKLLTPEDQEDQEAIIAGQKGEFTDVTGTAVREHPPHVQLPASNKQTRVDRTCITIAPQALVRRVCRGVQAWNGNRAHCIEDACIYRRRSGRAVAPAVHCRGAASGLWTSCCECTDASWDCDT